jgi:hypothetical protein
VCFTHVQDQPAGNPSQLTFQGGGLHVLGTRALTVYFGPYHLRNRLHRASIPGRPAGAGSAWANPAAGKGKTRPAHPATAAPPRAGRGTGAQEPRAHMPGMRHAGNLRPFLQPDYTVMRNLRRRASHRRRAARRAAAEGGDTMLKCPFRCPKGKWICCRLCEERKDWNPFLPPDPKKTCSGCGGLYPCD